MKAKYNGSMIVISRSPGSSYILAEKDDESVFQQKIGAFRVIPYFSRQKLELPADILKMIDISEEGLEVIKSAGDKNEVPDKEFGLDGIKLRTKGVDDFSEDELSESEFLNWVTLRIVITN